MNDAGLKLNDKAMAFAVRIVNLYKWLCDEKREYVLSKQLLRSKHRSQHCRIKIGNKPSRLRFEDIHSFERMQRDPILDRASIQDRLFK